MNWTSGLYTVAGFCYVLGGTIGHRDIMIVAGLLALILAKLEEEHENNS